MPLFAGDSDSDSTALTSIDDKVTGLLGFLSGGWIKAICLVALVVESIGVVVGGQQGGGGQVFKKLAPWIVGTVLLLCASSLTTYMTEGLSFSI